MFSYNYFRSEFFQDREQTFLTKSQSSIELSESEFDRMFRINVKQLYFCTKVVIPYFKKQGKGLFINLSSVSSTRPREGLVWYSSSKAAVSNVCVDSPLDLSLLNQGNIGNERTSCRVGASPDKIQCDLPGCR